jgi:hypothetical protein
MHLERTYLNNLNIFSQLFKIKHDKKKIQSNFPKRQNLVDRDEEEVDVEEAFINGKHRILVDLEYEYEE